MDRVARNHDVSRQSANHNIIIRLDNEILFLRIFFSHMVGVVVEREELWLMNGQAVFFLRIAVPSYIFPQPSQQLAGCFMSYFRKTYRHLPIPIFNNLVPAACIVIMMDFLSFEKHF